MIKRLFVRRSSVNDVHTGVVWLFRQTREHRPVIKITNHATNEQIYCEKLDLDDTYLYKMKRKGKRDTELIFMNEWYREKLGIKSVDEWVELEITEPIIKSWGKFMACVHHPQIVVRMSLWISVIGLVLGILGFIR